MFCRSTKEMCSCVVTNKFTSLTHSNSLNLSHLTMDWFYPSPQGALQTETCERLLEQPTI